MAFEKHILLAWILFVIVLAQLACVDLGLLGDRGHLVFGIVELAFFVVGDFFGQMAQVLLLVLLGRRILWIVNGPKFLGILKLNLNSELSLHICRFILPFSPLRR